MTLSTAHIRSQYGTPENMKTGPAKSKGQIAYEADVAKHPTYHDGTPRKTWEQLSDAVQRNWEG